MGKTFLPTTPKEFWESCDKSSADGCWRFKYNFFTKYRGRMILAHRLAWELRYKKKLPSKFTKLRHSCKNSWCVNPHHLYVGEYDRRNKPEDFWKKVDKKNGPILNKKLGRCWVWTASKFTTGGGYGQAFYEGSSYPAHRLSWLLTYGTLPANKLICHKCDNPPCVRPSHLFAGTNQENLDDMVKKGRWKGRPKGYKYSEETIAKMSAARKGKSYGPHSEETRAKMKEAWVRRRAVADPHWPFAKKKP